MLTFREAEESVYNYLRENGASHQTIRSYEKCYDEFSEWLVNQQASYSPDLGWKWLDEQRKVAATGKIKICKTALTRLYDAAVHKCITVNQNGLALLSEGYFRLNPNLMLELDDYLYLKSDYSKCYRNR